MSLMEIAITDYWELWVVTNYAYNFRTVKEVNIMRKSIFIYPIDRAIGEAIKELRSERGIRMRELAAIGKVPHSYFGKIENYERRLTFGEIEELAEWIGVDANEIISRAKEIIQEENKGTKIKPDNGSSTTRSLKPN